MYTIEIWHFTLEYIEARTFSLTIGVVTAMNLTHPDMSVFYIHGTTAADGRLLKFVIAHMPDLAHALCRNVPSNPVFHLM